MTDLTNLPWYGGNKIPDSYLAKFRTKTEDDDLPWELRMFLNDTTKGASNGQLRNRPD